MRLSIPKFLSLHSGARLYFYLLGLIFIGLSLGATCFADTVSAVDHLSTLAKNSLEERLSAPNSPAEIRFPSIKKIAQNPNFAEVLEVTKVKVLEENAAGIATLEVTCLVLGTNGSEKQITKIIRLPFEAWVKVPVATRRIYPNTKLKNEDFVIQSVNVATGSNREYRGIFASPHTKFERTQSKQTILEGRFLTVQAMEREPDIRRGETVRLELISGELSLTTQGVAQEAGVVGERIHVLSAKTKKEVSGIVREDRTIEVKL